MAGLSKVLDTDNTVFCAFVTCSSILVLKMMGMSILTGRQRKIHGVPASPEDLTLLKGKTIESHPDVDRVRRAHLNDLENIPIFYMAGIGYALTDPNPSVAVALYSTYTLARIAHTIVYAVHVVPQPARGISWGVGFAITGYMAMRTIKYFCCDSCIALCQNWVH
ncbi:hypothetical protein PPYR_01113 [Photinus pyralis]|uniref:Microsomal glutathione S-transferase 1 n=1 Tax=Photinus pyralis TaxID=7054 RepID=A0A1Y1N358_PHOPY|nr:microsomal glutathione S-transferase 1-like [Photinus pyralis]KAB0804143.1 hypothetical protein PPYR_01113 [Photinus pyralis]